MGRRSKNRGGGGFSETTDWSTERTMADAEADAQAQGEQKGEGSDTRCICGHNEFALEAYLHVVDGKPKPDPIDVVSLTCPECGREYEPIEAEGGRILRGDFTGWADLDEGD